MDPKASTRLCSKHTPFSVSSERFAHCAAGRSHSAAPALDCALRRCHGTAFLSTSRIRRWCRQVRRNHRTTARWRCRADEGESHKTLKINAIHPKFRSVRVLKCLFLQRFSLQNELPLHRRTLRRPAQHPRHRHDRHADDSGDVFERGRAGRGHGVRIHRAVRCGSKTSANGQSPSDSPDEVRHVQGNRQIDGIQYAVKMLA